MSVSRSREVRQIADLVSDHQLQIPQRMQKPAQERLVLGADRPLEQDQDVDVGMEREVPPSVAAEGEDGDRAGRRRRVEEEALEQRVDAIGVALGRGVAGGAADRVLDQLLARGFERGRGARRSTGYLMLARVLIEVAQAYRVTAALGGSRPTSALAAADASRCDASRRGVARCRHRVGGVRRAP